MVEKLPIVSVSVPMFVAPLPIEIFATIPFVLLDITLSVTIRSTSVLRTKSCLAES